MGSRGRLTGRGILPFFYDSEVMQAMTTAITLLVQTNLKMTKRRCSKTRNSSPRKKMYSFVSIVRHLSDACWTTLSSSSDDDSTMALAETAKTPPSRQLKNGVPMAGILRLSKILSLEIMALGLGRPGKFMKWLQLGPRFPLQ